MTYLQKLPPKKLTFRRNLWLERLLAIIALINLGLVFFDLSYIPWRDFYFQKLPSLVQVYDPIKGIEPHRETQKYLNTVNQLQLEVSNIGLQSLASENLLQQLRDLSNEMIEDNPFAEANKSRNLAKIKNKMRSRMHQESAHQAFNEFWSKRHLLQAGWEPEINFFNTQIRPLIATNYYRDIDVNGQFVDNFWRIDLPFVILFAFEYLIRTYYISRNHPDLNWLEAMLRRWFDVFLLLPFWRWLRVIPVTVRLYQSRLLNLEPLRAQVNHDIVINFADEITEIVGVRIINQAQDAIARGDVARWLFHPEARRRYININNRDEVQAIATRLLHLSVYEVLPKMQPDIHTLVHHVVTNTLNQSPIYKQIQSVPGISQLPNQLTERLATDISQSTYNTLANILQDPVVMELSNRLIENFGKAFQGEVQKQQNIAELQALLVDLLEEIKINYVKGIATEGVEKLWEESYKLRKITRP